MKYQFTMLLTALLILFGCKKNNNAPDNPPRITEDTLMVYGLKNSNGNTAILTKRFKTGEVKTVVTGADYPFATNLRMVYIKQGTTLGFAKLDGVSKLIIQLTQPTYPSLSIDSRLISVVDQLSDKYQLLLFDTLGNRTTLHETENQISSPSFTADGQSIAFAKKITSEKYGIFVIPIIGGTPRQLTPDTVDSCDANCTVVDERVFFTQTHTIGGKPSSEIFSVNLDGTALAQHSTFTSNWSVPTFSIKNLRTVNSSTLIFVSGYNNTNSEVFLWKTSDATNPALMTETEDFESFPSMIPDYLDE